MNFIVSAKSLNLFDEKDKVIGIAGQGTFGTVLECFDNKHKEKVAIKAVRSVDRYLDAAKIEIEMLERLDRKDYDRNS
jgi:dual-specificity kinase